MEFKVIDHPLVKHKLTILRDKDTPSSVFRQLVDELVTLLAYEATRHVRVTPKQIETPIQSMKGEVISTPRPIVIPKMCIRDSLGHRSSNEPHRYLQYSLRLAELTQNPGPG